MKRSAPHAGMIIREDPRFVPGVYVFGGSQVITIAADDIDIDGRGAILKTTPPEPELPVGDFLCCPGDLGLSREEHELLIRGIEIHAEGPLRLEYRFWGKRGDSASVAVSRDGRDWRGVPLSCSGLIKTEDTEGWEQRRCHIGEWTNDSFWLKILVPAESISAESPCFYDAFRVLADAEVIWRGDAREHWNCWCNTGFSILQRATKRYHGGIAIRSEGCRGVRLRNVKAEGFLTGLFLENCNEWTIIGSDFSDNSDDPDYGWGDGT